MALADANRPLRIGQLAAELGLNPKTIRYYEDIGLLPKPRRTESGYRLYGKVDRERLEFIRKARAIGLTLEEIGRLLSLRRDGEQPCGHLRELVDQKLTAVDAQLRALEDFRQELVALRDEAAEGTCGDGQVCGVIEHHRPTHPTSSSPPILLTPIHRRR